MGLHCRYRIWPGINNITMLGGCLVCDRGLEKPTHKHAEAGDDVC